MKDFYPEGFTNEGLNLKNTVLDLNTLQDAYKSQQVLEAKAFMCDSAHNLIVNLNGVRGIIPRDEGAIGINENKVRDIALISRVGKSVCFTVKSLETDSFGKPYAILSRKNAQLLCRENFISKLTPGDIINATITHLESFGAFCDIGCGLIALLPIDSISVSRISHPRDRFSPGNNIKAVVKQIAPDGKITLSHKELLGTWEENAQKFAAGQTVSGVIRSVESYGVFVEITPNLAGLAEPKNDVFIGQKASVYIKSIIPEKMKVKLIIIDNFDSDYSPQINYFYSGNHINSWYYSTKDCFKQIYTLF
ncbi:MAG: S1 RNA-binding domain-containing protein [Clostridia bacterium]|nr:S1 RNA-binding domain-containing protein [Clostridia bacterium]